MKPQSVACVVFAILGFAVSGVGAAEFAAECGSPDEPMNVVVGEYVCQRMHSDALGGVTAFSYYVPDRCVGRRCPVLFITHGTGGSYQVSRSYGGVEAGEYPWVAALTSKPPVDPKNPVQTPDPTKYPWQYWDPATWVPAEPIDAVLISPHNRTVPKGNGPLAWTDGGWIDWNPRYAAGGDSTVYDSPPPRFTTHVVRELIPFVEANLPVGAGRDYRMITGHSQGGLGALVLPLQHPDEFATLSAHSGASLPIGSVVYPPLAAPLRRSLQGLAPGLAPIPTTYVPLLGVVPAIYPAQNIEADPTGFVNALRGFFVGLGDPIADEAYWRGNTSQELAMNARAWAGGVQSLPIDMFDNDSIDWADLTSGVPIDYLEVVGRTLITLQGLAFDSEEVAYHHETFPGTHGARPYKTPYYRYYLERMYARVRHADGGGEPPPRPDRFDYRSVQKSFSVWGWSFTVERQPVEFLQLLDVRCSGLTLQGSGVVTVTVPEECGTGRDGATTFPVDLGPSLPTDEHGPLSAPGVYGKPVRVALAPL